jgi:sterol desaturase/sphingolipid hydroxylase (fatty acid hydroxylase superfamily)
VHPFEFITGEYLHLLTIYVVAKYVMDIHMLAVIIFISIGGILASLNHTRYDIDLCWGYLYSVKAHDVHHRLPESNYSQYILFWDWVWGTFRPYEGTAAMKSNGDEPEESSKSK